MANERTDVVKGCSSDGFTRENSEPGLDHVDPGSARRSEMKVKARMCIQPLTDGGCGMSGRVVQDDV